MTSSADAEMRRVSAMLAEMRIKADQGDLLGAFAINVKLFAPGLSDEEARERGAMTLAALRGPAPEIRGILEVALAGDIGKAMAMAVRLGYRIDEERGGVNNMGMKRYTCVVCGVSVQVSDGFPVLSSAEGELAVCDYAGHRTAREELRSLGWVSLDKGWACSRAHAELARTSGE